jgi:hypothetical protein
MLKHAFLNTKSVHKPTLNLDVLYQKTFQTSSGCCSPVLEVPAIKPLSVRSLQYSFINDAAGGDTSYCACA